MSQHIENAPNLWFGAFLVAYKTKGSVGETFVRAGCVPECDDRLTGLE